MFKKYEKPMLIDLNLSSAEGVCENGSIPTGDDGYCTDGDAATSSGTNSCGAGLNASGECSSGSNPKKNRCSAGLGYK